MTGAVLVLMSWPILTALGLLALTAWRQARREAAIERQIRLTDALADELGLIVAPVVTKPARGPWRAAMRVPIGEPGVVGRIVAIADETLTRAGASPYVLVLTPRPAPPRPLRPAARRPRRRRAA
jgi:hypothetical protein